MSTILEQAVQIVAVRENMYYTVIADIYFMAVLSGDERTEQQIWHEAWDMSNGAQIAALVSADLQIRAVQGSILEHDE